MPDRIEVATSGRARCRACRGAIAKGDERFAEAAPNPVAEGESQHYYHLRCAAERRPKTFSVLLESLDPARSDLSELRAAAALALAYHRLERLGVLERAKSARANCRQCHALIERDTWRVALQPIEDGRLGTWGFVHLDCVADYAGIKPSLERLAHYTALSDEDRAEVGAKLEALPEPIAAPAPSQKANESEPPPDSERNA
jgi:hypothetical protein